MKIILSCEHASNYIPAKFQYLFVGADELLASHRGWDPGSLELARIFSKVLDAPLFVAPASRLLVEPNRSLGNPRLFSKFTKTVDGKTKERLLNKFYFPHRNAVAAAISEHIVAGQIVLHIGLHTFVPELNGVVRNADVGLLYDPERRQERDLCRHWRQAILERQPELRVRRNYPYLGKADGFTTFLRRQYPEFQYLGVELEVNQRIINPAKSWNHLAHALKKGSGAEFRE